MNPGVLCITINLSEVQELYVGGSVIIGSTGQETIRGLAVSQDVINGLIQEMRVLRNVHE